MYTLNSSFVEERLILIDQKGKFSTLCNFSKLSILFDKY